MMAARVFLLLLCGVMLCGGIVMRGSAVSEPPDTSPTVASLASTFLSSFNSITYSDATVEANFQPASGDWTISGWVKGNSNPGATSARTWFMIDDGTGALWCHTVQLDQAGANSVVEVINGQTNANWTGQAWTQGDTWTYIALIRRGTDFDFYVDGILQSQSQAPGTGQCNQAVGSNNISLIVNPYNQALVGNMFLTRFWTEDRCGGAATCATLQNHATCKIDPATPELYQEWLLDNVLTGRGPVQRDLTAGTPLPNSNISWDTGDTPFPNYTATVGSLNGSGPDCVGG